MIEIDLSKQQVFDANPKAMQKINFTGDIGRAEGTAILFIIAKAKQTILGVSQETVRVL